MQSIALLVLLMVAASASGNTADVILQAKTSGACGMEFSSYFWIPKASLPALGMTGFPNGFCGKDCGVMTIGGKKYNLDQINPKDGHDACKLCNCDLAYIQLKAGQRFGGKLKCGAKVSITYSGPPAAPTPPPTPKLLGTLTNIANVPLHLP